MKEFTVDFSKKVKFGYFTKLVNKQSDSKLGLATQETYYLFGTIKLKGNIDLNIDDYVIELKEYVEPNSGNVLQLKYIVGLK